MSNIETIQAFLDAFNAKDVDRVISFFADEAVYHNMPAKPVEGVEAIRASITGYAAPATSIDWELLSVAEAEGGTVLTERIDRFDFGDNHVELPVMGAFDFAGGRITAWRDYFDMAQFRSQMSGG